MRRSGIAAMLIVALGMSACGGDDSKSSAGKDVLDAANAYKKATEDAKKQLEDFQKNQKSNSSKYTIPSYKPPEREFTKYEGTVRFANFYAKDGAGVDLDVYFGSTAESGKKIGTMKYGEVSDPTAMYVEQSPYVSNADGTDSLRLLFLPAGKTATTDMVYSDDKTLKKGADYLYALGWDKPFGGGSGLTSQLAYIQDLATPADGKGVVVLNDIGTRGTEDGQFSSLGIDGDCNGLPSLQDFQSGNLGSAYAVDPGSHEVFSYDANTQCVNKSAAQTIDVKAGEVWVLFAWATSRDAISTSALKIT
ncbi:MAG: hypothetical protein WBD02_05555 [Acidimicrobiia bacterium]